MHDLMAESWMAPIEGFEPSGICVLPGEAVLLVVCDEGQLARVALEAPEAPTIWPIEPRTDLEGVSIAPDGRLLVLAERKNQVWQVQNGRRVSKWKIRPKADKKAGYEGMVITGGERPLLLLSTQGKRAMLRTFAIPTPEDRALILLAEQQLPWGDVAGLAWHKGALLALSDRQRILALMTQDEDDEWKVQRTWRTPVSDLEGVAVCGDAGFFAQDPGGLWLGPWPQP